MPRTKFDQVSFTTAGNLKTAFAAKGFSEVIHPLATYYLASNDLSLVIGKTAEGLWRIDSPLTGFDVLDPYDDGLDLRRAYVLEELQHIFSNYVSGHSRFGMAKSRNSWTYTITDNNGQNYTGTNAKQVEALAAAMINFLNSSPTASMLSVAQRLS